MNIYTGKNLKRKNSLQWYKQKRAQINMCIYFINKMTSVDKTSLTKFPVFKVKDLYEQEQDKKKGIEYIDPYKDHIEVTTIYNKEGEYIGKFQGVGSVLDSASNPTQLNLGGGNQMGIENAYYIKKLEGGKKRRTKRHRKNRRTTKRRRHHK